MNTATAFEHALRLLTLGAPEVEMAVNAEFNDYTVITDADPFFIVAELVFCAFFTTELVISDLPAAPGAGSLSKAMHPASMDVASLTLHVQSLREEVSQPRICHLHNDLPSNKRCLVLIRLSAGRTHELRDMGILVQALSITILRLLLLYITITITITIAITIAITITRTITITITITIAIAIPITDTITNTI